MPAGLTERDIQVGVNMGWHGKTVIVDKIDKSNCGIVYAMDKKQLHILDDDGNIITKEVPVIDKKGKETGEFETVPACDHFSIVALDDGLPIGNPVGYGYKLISNDQMVDMVESSMAGTSHEIVSIGTVANRSKVFCSIKLSDNIIAGNRETQNILNILWGHGGVFGVNAMSGFTVVLCKNSFSKAIREGKKSEFKLKMKHTGNCELKIENMGKAIEGHYGVTAEFKLAMDSLNSQSIAEPEAKKIFAGFLVRDSIEELTEVSSRTSNTIDRLTDLFRGGAGNDGNDMSDVFNSFTDYYSHESSGGSNRWRQFESSEFGAGARFKTEAFDLLTGKRVPKLGDLDEVLKRGEKVLQLV